MLIIQNKCVYFILYNFSWLYILFDIVYRLSAIKWFFLILFDKILKNLHIIYNDVNSLMLTLSRTDVIQCVYCHRKWFTLFKPHIIGNQIFLKFWNFRFLKTCFLSTIWIVMCPADSFRQPHNSAPRISKSLNTSNTASLAM